MSARSKIVNALVEQIKLIDGISPYNTTLHGNVEAKQVFWDEVDDYPYVCVNAGTETREYQAAGFKWGFLLISIKIYTDEQNTQARLENIIEDIEYTLDLNHSTLVYNIDTGDHAEDLRILQIATDEGVFHPTGVGEITIQVRYEVL